MRPAAVRLDLSKRRPLLTSSTRLFTARGMSSRQSRQDRQRRAARCHDRSMPARRPLEGGERITEPTFDLEFTWEWLIDGG